MATEKQIPRPPWAVVLMWWDCGPALGCVLFKTFPDDPIDLSGLGTIALEKPCARSKEWPWLVFCVLLPICRVLLLTCLHISETLVTKGLGSPNTAVGLAPISQQMCCVRKTSGCYLWGKGGLFLGHLLEFWCVMLCGK